MLVCLVARPLKPLLIYTSNLHYSIVKCDHVSKSKDWLPLKNGIIKRHPYCELCGTVKNVSSDRGKRLSFFIVAVSKLRKLMEKKGYKISDAQIRLIIKELSELEDFNDTWWITFSRQKEIFVSVIKKYVNVSEDTINSILQKC